MKVEATTAWIVTGSLCPTIERDDGSGFTSGIDGFDLYVEHDGKRYCIPNYSLEQFKIETNK